MISVSYTHLDVYKRQLYEQQNNVNASNATGTDVNESRLREEMTQELIGAMIQTGAAVASII